MGGKPHDGDVRDVDVDARVVHSHFTNNHQLKHTTTHPKTYTPSSSHCVPHPVHPHSSSSGITTGITPSIATILPITSVITAAPNPPHHAHAHAHTYVPITGAIIRRRLNLSTTTTTAATTIQSTNAVGARGAPDVLEHNLGVTTMLTSESVAPHIDVVIRKQMELEKEKENEKEKEKLKTREGYETEKKEKKTNGIGKRKRK